MVIELKFNQMNPLGKILVCGEKKIKGRITFTIVANNMPEIDVTNLFVLESK